MTEEKKEVKRGGEPCKEDTGKKHKDRGEEKREQRRNQTPSERNSTGTPRENSQLADRRVQHSDHTATLHV